MFSLSKDVRNRNIRKVETNARVAFVIWIMEFGANICIIIVWAIVYRKTTFANESPTAVCNTSLYASNYLTKNNVQNALSTTSRA